MPDSNAHETLVERLEKQIAVLEKNLAISHRNRARLEDKREKSQRILETVNAELGETLDELKRAQTSLIQSEKLAALGQLTGGIAHEIKNPLNFVNNFSELSIDLLEEFSALAATPLKSLAEDDRADALDLLETIKGNLVKIASHGGRADQIVKNMLAHSHQGPGEARRFNFNEMLNESLQLAYHGARAKDADFHIAITQELDPSIDEIEGYPQELSRVFLNLVNNGFYAVSKRRQKCAETDFEPMLLVRSSGRGDRVEVLVEDNGIGIPKNIQDDIFAPFFTTKPAGEGTGLGLSISYDVVVKQHGGTMSVESEPKNFTRFRVSLPRSMRDDA